MDVEHSFAVQHPQIAEMWDKEGNGKQTPFMFTSGSSYPAIWKCPKCGNTWQSPISSIVARKVSSCKDCSMKENGSIVARKKLKKAGSLAQRSEALLRQWDVEANGDLSPYEVSLNYSSKVAWKCDKCGYKWNSTPNSRVRNGKVSSCPHCSGRVAMPGVDDLETLFPYIAAQWDYEKNGSTLPSQVKPHSNNKLFWMCPTCGKSYVASVHNRVEGHGCRKCASIAVAKKTSKAVGQYDGGMLINVYESLRLAAEAMGVGKNAIFQAVKNGTKSKGFYWKYVSAEET